MRKRLKQSKLLYTQFYYKDKQIAALQGGKQAELNKMIRDIDELDRGMRDECRKFNINPNEFVLEFRVSLS